ncbi:MAG: hypothetical protein ACR2QO_01990 [Acidimicrobiales bacterium]
MELLLLFLGIGLAAAAVIWWSARTKTYRVKNRDVAPTEQMVGTREKRPELDISKMLD